jgi:hypothetical protein
MTHFDPNTIFITIVFLATDKLISPHCYNLVHHKLQKNILPFSQQQVRMSLANLKDNSSIHEST